MKHALRLIVLLHLLSPVLGCRAGEPIEAVEGPNVQAPLVTAHTTNGREHLSLVRTGPKTWASHLVGQRLTAEFSDHGTRISSDDVNLSLHVVRWGRGGHHKEVEPTNMSVSRGRLSYARDDLEEWFKPTSVGLDHGMTLNSRPAGKGHLAIDVEVDGLAPQLVGPTSIALVGGGITRLWYHGLAVYDRNGLTVPAWFQVQHGRTAGGVVRVIIDDIAHEYPLRIDPVVVADLGVGWPLNGTEGDRFGSAVALHGQLLLAGAPGRTFYRGSAYVFKSDANHRTWTELTELHPPTESSDQHFGSAVALNGHEALVGATGVGTMPGEVYAYHYDSQGNWTKKQELADPSQAPGSRFGHAIAITETLAVVGAPGLNTEQGSATIFSWNAAAQQWVKDASVSALGGVIGDQFGYGVAAHEATVVIGAPRDRDGGAVYVFRKDSNSHWTQTAKLVASVASAGARFGHAVAIRGDNLVATAPGGQDGTGMAYAFRTNDQGQTWSSPQVILSPQTPPIPAMGNAISLLDQRVYIGATGPNYEGMTQVFDQDATGQWVNNGEISSLDHTSDACLATFENVLAIGIPFRGANRGMVDFFLVGEANGVSCRAGSQCLGLLCVDDVCCDTTCAGPCDRCDLSGDQGRCKVAPSRSEPSSSCAGYLCDGQSASCPSSCKAHEDCSTDHACIMSKCEPRRDLGQPCEDAPECRSRFCVKGICCSAACNQGCGTCSSSEHLGTCVALGQGQGNCDGTACDGVSLACPTTCKIQSDCAKGYICRESQCVEALGPGVACDQGTQCATGHCVNSVCCLEASCGAYRCRDTGSCAQECTSNFECAQGYECDAHKRCLPQGQDSSSAEAGSCSMVRGPRRGRAWPQWLSLGLLLVGSAWVVRTRRWAFEGKR